MRLKVDKSQLISFSKRKIDPEYKLNNDPAPKRSEIGKYFGIYFTSSLNVSVCGFI